VHIVVLVHTPAEHARPAPHALLQRPQCMMFVRTSTQLPPQSICGAVHAGIATQVLPTHDCPAVHALPQRPQFAASIAVSTHIAAHCVRGAVQPIMAPAHTPSAHPPGQLVSVAIEPRASHTRARIALRH
jgi:hypothetical protein